MIAYGNPEFRDILDRLDRIIEAQWGRRGSADSADALVRALTLKARILGLPPDVS